MKYKGYQIWYNDLQGRWLVQHGYVICHSAKTLGAAKSWVTRSRRLADSNAQRGYENLTKTYSKRI